jgi:acetyltransferase-like isoleucine patch superfamily enzyme
MLENRFKNYQYPKMEHGKLTEWNWLPYHPEKIGLGKNVDIGAFTCLFAHEGIEIGDEAQIGSHCSIYSLNTEDNIRGKVVIKEGAKIGSHSVIFPNVVIEKDEKIKAGSIVYVDSKGFRKIKEMVKKDEQR